MKAFTFFNSLFLISEVLGSDLAQYPPDSSQQKGSDVPGPATSCDDDKKKILCLPHDYSKFDLPYRNDFNLIDIGIEISDVLKIDDKDYSITFSLYFNVQWGEPRMNLSKEFFSSENITSDDQLVPVNLELFNDLWVPNIFIYNLKTFKVIYVLSKLAGLWINNKKEIYYSQATHITFICPMLFDSFPLDTQVCKFQVGSYSYDMTRMLFNISHLTFIQKQSIVLDYSIEILNLMPRDKVFLAGALGNYSLAGFQMNLRRHVMSYIITYYLPSGLFVVVSWISFLIPPDIIPGRMALLITLFLVLINIFNNITTNSPKAEGLTAIEIWMLACILFVFGSLIEYAVILFKKQKVYQNAANLSDREARKRRTNSIIYGHDRGPYVNNSGHHPNQQPGMHHQQLPPHKPGCCSRSQTYEDLCQQRQNSDSSNCQQYESSSYGRGKAKINHIDICTNGLQPGQRATFKYDPGNSKISQVTTMSNHLGGNSCGVGGLPNGGIAQTSLMTKCQCAFHQGFATMNEVCPPFSGCSSPHLRQRNNHDHNKNGGSSPLREGNGGGSPTNLQALLSSTSSVARSPTGNANPPHSSSTVTALNGEQQIQLFRLEIGNSDVDEYTQEGDTIFTSNSMLKNNKSSFKQQQKHLRSSECCECECGGSGGSICGKEHLIASNHQGLSCKPQQSHYTQPQSANNGGGGGDEDCCRKLQHTTSGPSTSLTHHQCSSDHLRPASYHPKCSSHHNSHHSHMRKEVRIARRKSLLDKRYSTWNDQFAKIDRFFLYCSPFLFLIFNSIYWGYFYFWNLFFYESDNDMPPIQMPDPSTMG